MPIEVRSSLFVIRYNDVTNVQTDYLASIAYRYVASRRMRLLLPIYNLIDDVVFKLPFMKPMRPFVLTRGEGE
jgi:hypothetical protein